MNQATALRLLTDMTQAGGVPGLTSAELTDLLLLYRRPGPGGAPLDAWEASYRYREGEQRIPNVDNGYAFEVTTFGVSGATEPAWTTVEETTVTDGSVVWTNIGAYEYVADWDLSGAAAEGWRWQAQKVVAEYDVALGDGVDATRSQQYQHCMDMANRYGGSVWFGAVAPFGRARRTFTI